MIVNPSDVNFDGRPLVSHVLQFLLNCLRTASRIVQIVFQQLRCFLEGQLDDSVGSEPEGNPFEALFGLSPHEDAFAEHEVDLSTCMRWGVLFLEESSEIIWMVLSISGILFCMDWRERVSWLSTSLYLLCC